MSGAVETTRTAQSAQLFEFHDSTVSAIMVHGTSVRIVMDAYLNRWERVDGRWKGTGWMQPVQLVLVNSSHEVQAECPVRVTDGGVQAGQVTYKSLVSLPFESSGPAALRLELVTGSVLDFNGDDLVIEPLVSDREDQRSTVPVLYLLQGFLSDLAV